MSNFIYKDGIILSDRKKVSYTGGTSKFSFGSKVYYNESKSLGMFIYGPLASDVSKVLTMMEEELFMAMSLLQLIDNDRSYWTMTKGMTPKQKEIKYKRGLAVNLTIMKIFNKLAKEIGSFSPDMADIVVLSNFVLFSRDYMIVSTVRDNEYLSGEGCVISNCGWQNKNMKRMQSLDLKTPINVLKEEDMKLFEAEASSFWFEKDKLYFGNFSNLEWFTMGSGHDVTTAIMQLKPTVYQAMAYTLRHDRMGGTDLKPNRKILSQMKPRNKFTKKQIGNYMGVN